MRETSIIMRTIIILFLLSFLFNHHNTEGKDVHLSFSIKTSKHDASFPMLLGNKKWNKGEDIDLTSNHNLGLTKSSGTLKGWAIILQPNGSWAWNIGNGDARLDYMPTYERQPLNDGNWHQLGFSFVEKERIVRLFYDGKLVAVYSLDDLREENLYSLFARKTIYSKSTAKIKDVSNETIDVSSYYTEVPPQKKTDSLNILSWNIWHGGRRDGNIEGLQNTIEIIKETQADIICMQETYGSGAVIADSLNYIFYYRSSNLSIHSRFPILETHGDGDPFRIGGVTLGIGEDQQIKVFSLWINSSPNIDVTIPLPISSDSLISLEHTTRVKEINQIMGMINELETDIPIVIAGDFNSPSHLDWTESTSVWHQQRTTAWPVSKTMITEGYTDAFREIFPEPSSNYGRTWSPRFLEEGCQERIDHIYYKGTEFTPFYADMLDRNSINWPSDHAAVLVKFIIQ